MTAVFISSTSVDLQAYRAAVRRACDELSLGVVDMKDFEAADLDAVGASLAKLDGATVYVGVFAHRYGFVPPGHDRSVTEQEFDRATALGLERLCFLVDPSFDWPKEYKQRGQLRRVQAFHRKVRDAGLVVDTFTTAENLHHVVFLALQRWQGRRGLLGPRQIRPAAADFVGRQEHLAALCAGFDRGASIHGVSGQGGVGKTELALKLVERIGERFRDGHVFLDLRGFDPVQPPLPRRDILAHVIRAFRPEERLPDGDAALEGLYQGVLAGKRVLLLLDNAAGPEQIRHLQPPAGCALVVTSRRRFTLPGLTPCDLDALPQTEAESMLRSLAERLTAAEAAELAGLCGRLPLALRLAGSLLAERDDLPPRRHAERLRAARFGERGGLSPVAASIQLSEETLPLTLRQAWRELAVLAGGFEADWSVAVWDADADEIDDRLAALQKISLLRWDTAVNLYRLHDLVREYADAALTAERRTELRLRHARFFADALWKANDLYLQGGDNVAEVARRFDRLWPDATAGVVWLGGRPAEDREAQELCVAYPDRAIYLLSLRRHPQERIAWLGIAVKAARTIGDRSGEGNALGNLGLAYADLGQPQRAIEFYEQHLAIAREIGAHRSEGCALGNLGFAYAALGQPKRAIEFHEQVLAITREIGDCRSEGNVLGNLGNAYFALGQPQRAIEFYEQYLAIAREIGDRRGEGNALGNLGSVYAVLGQPQRAIEFHEQFLAIAQEIGDRRGEGNALGNLGLAYADLSQPQRAIEFHEQFLAIAREIGDRSGEGAALGNLGNPYYALGQPQRAIEFYEQYLAIAREIGDRRGEGNALGNLGSVYAVLGQPQRAIEFYEQCLAIDREIGDRRGEARDCWNMGDELVKLGRVAEAIPLMEACIAFEQEIGHPDAVKDAAQVEQLRHRLAAGDGGDSSPPEGTADSASSSSTATDA